MDNIYTVGSGSLQMVLEFIPDPGVGVCLAPQSHGTQQGRCVCMGDVCDIPHRIRENVPGAIYVEVLLNLVDTF